MQRMVDLFAEACANVGLTISIKKTEVMFQPSLGEPYVEPHIIINGQRLEVTDEFPYLGSAMSNSATIDDEISLHVRASASFGMLRGRVWKIRGLSFETKLYVYHVECVPAISHAISAGGTACEMTGAFAGGGSKQSRTLNHRGGVGGQQ